MSATEAVPDLLEIIQAQHEAIDELFARLINADHSFHPTQCGMPWKAFTKGYVTLLRAQKYLPQPRMEDFIGE